MARTSLASLASLMRARAHLPKRSLGSAIAYRAATAVGHRQPNAVVAVALQEQFTPNLVQKLLSQQEVRSPRYCPRASPACGRNGGKCCRERVRSFAPPPLRLLVRSRDG